MRYSNALLVAHVTLAAIACNGSSGDGGTGDTGAAPPPEFDFRQTVGVTEFEATIAQNVIDAQQMTNTLLAAMGVVSADTAVLDTYTINGGPSEESESNLRGIVSCWQRPQFWRWSFDMNFGTKECDQFDMGGAVNVNNHPAGMLLFTYQNFLMNGREMGGSFAFDRTGANPEDYFWKVYNTLAEDPGPENRGNGIGIILSGNAPRGLQYEGGANLDLLDRELSMWGEAEISGDPPITVVHGAEVPGVVLPDEPPGIDAVSMPLQWTTCRCPTSGVSSLDMPLEIEAVTIDIDDLEQEPDEIDDEQVTIRVQETILGRAVLEHQTKCGSYGVDYQLAEGASSTIEVPTSALFASVTFLCDTFTINDPARCNALFRAIGDLGETFSVEFTDADLDATAAAAVENDFDTSWCTIY